MSRSLLAILGWLVAGSVLGAAPIAVDDDGGYRVQLDAPARRIVSLSPGLTESLFVIGAGNRVVGVDAASDYPSDVRALPRVGSAAGVDLERLLALRPDLVLVWGRGASARLIAWLRAAGIAVYVSEPRRLEQVADTLERLGRLTGNETPAAAQAAAFRRRLDSLRQRYRRTAPLTVFYQVWDDPLITINGDQFISEVITLCGGVNVFAGLAASAPRVSIEAVLARDPQVMVAGVVPGQPDPLAHWRGWPMLRAVRDDLMFRLPADLMQRPSVRLLDGAQMLCTRIARAADSESSAHR